MTKSSPPANAGVHFPPPLLYVIGFLLGLGLDRWHPLPLTAGPSLGRTLGAAVCFAGFAAIFLSALITFVRLRTAIIPNRPARTLATGGPYRMTRNPMYVSLAVLYVGLTLIVNSWWPLPLLAVVLVVVDRAVIAREERYLAAAFPVDYATYRARVRRWL